MMARIVLLAFGALLAVGGREVAAQQTSTPTCHDTPRYFVVTLDHNEAVGSKILVRRKPTSATRFACEFTRMPGDYVNDDTDGDAYYLKMQDQYLLLDNGTGTARGLTIFDVTTGRRILTRTGYDANRPVRTDAMGVTFWQVGVDATPANCPRLATQIRRQRASGAIITLVTFTFADRHIEKTQQTACIDRE